MRFKKWLWLIAIICLGFLAIHLSIEPLYTPTAISTPAHHAFFPRYIAHKSLVSGNYKGNTLEAIQEALASYVDGIELDIRFSKDGIPFVYHGDTLATITGQDTPEDQTWEQLQQLSYRDERQSKLVSLEAVFKLVGSQKDIFLDIKTDKIFNGKFADKISELIQKYNLEDSVIVESLNPFFLVSMRLTDRDILLMYDFTLDAPAQGEEVQSQFDKIPWLFKQPFFQKQIRRIVRPDILGPRWNLDEESIKFLVEHGYPIICWTVDDPNMTMKLFDWGVKGVQTNKALELMAATSRANQVVYDAGGSHEIETVVNVKNIQDILRAIEEAKAQHKKITIAGRRHSMGGQTLLKGSIQLNMLGMNSVFYNEKDETVTVGSGATWKKIQKALDKYGRSVRIMQSDNIFTVGGSISVNVHGWQAGDPPLASTIVSMKVITADGELRRISKTEEPELFSAVIGGYGQFGVIIEAEITTTTNSELKFYAEFMKPGQFANSYQKLITKNSNAELAYGRLSVDSGHLFEEAGLFWYEKVGDVAPDKIQGESMTAIKRGIFRTSQYYELGKKIRWAAEKIDAKRKLNSGPLSRNNAMNSDIHLLWPLYGQNKDILHEYFIPKDKLPEFLEAFKTQIVKFDMNILNVTIREVRQDKMSLLPYAKQDVFALVCLFSQAQTAEDEFKMKAFTQKVIDEAIRLKGSFYLPYRLHYTKEQVYEAYPALTKWLEIKKQWDPEKIFDSQFFEYIDLPTTSPQ